MSKCWENTILVPSNWEATCLLWFVQTITQAQRSDERHSKQDRPFRLITILIVIDLRSVLQTEFQGYFHYHFTAKEFLSSQWFPSAQVIWLISAATDLPCEWFVCGEKQEYIQVYTAEGSSEWCSWSFNNDWGEQPVWLRSRGCCKSFYLPTRSENAAWKV